MAWALATQRQYKVIFKSKPDDVRYDAHAIRKAASIDDQRYTAFVLNPRGKTALANRIAQRQEFAAALDKIWQQGGWTAYLDEVFYLSETLKLGLPIDTLLTQGRSKGISVAGGVQRPVRVTRFLLTEATHVCSFRLEGRDAKEFADATSDFVGREVVKLPEHHFVWYRRPDRLWVGRLDLKEGRLIGEYVR